MKQLIESARNITAGDLLGAACLAAMIFGLPWAGAILEAITQ